jgi:hypothetical protein
MGRSQYELALHYLVLMERRPAKGEGDRHRFQLKLLKGYALGGLGRREEALRTLLGFQRGLQGLGSSTDELRYLRCYAAAVGNDIIKASGDWDLAEDDKILLTPNYDDVDLAKVPSGTKRYFPLQYHPLWPGVISKKADPFAG